MSEHGHIVLVTKKEAYPCRNFAAEKAPMENPNDVYGCVTATVGQFQRSTQQRERRIESLTDV